MQPPARRRPSVPARAAALALAVALAAGACRTGAPGAPDAADDPDPAPPGEATERAARETPAPAATPRTTPAPRHSPTPAGAPDADRPPGQAGLGVTAEPCPAAVNPGNGCLYLGALEDLGRADRARLGTAGGDLARLGTASSEARAAFWQRVNERGGIAGYDVDASTYTRDSGADPGTHVLALREIRSEVLALAASQGIAATAAIVPSLRELPMAAVTTTASSAWAGTAEVVTVGATACVDAANGVDYVLGGGGGGHGGAGGGDGGSGGTGRAGGSGGVAVVYLPGAFGEDAAAGAALAADRRDSPFGAVALPGPGAGAAGAEAIDAAAARVLDAGPRVVVVATGARELATLAGRLAAGRFRGTIVALSAGWDERLADRLPPGAAARLLVAGPWAPWGADTAGHAALRGALGEALEDELEPREAHVAGWVRQYPLARALEAAAGDGPPAPRDVLDALHDLDAVDGDGMLPHATGDAAAAAHSVISAVDPGAPTGLAARTGHFAGATARALDLTRPCPPPG